MANILYPPSRPQSVGEILDCAFRIFGATLVKCLPYGIAGVILGQLPNLYDLAKNGRLRVDPASRLALVQDRIFWLSYLVGLFLALLFANAVMLRQYALVRGHETAAGEELRRGAARVPGVVLIVIVMMLAMLATMIPVVIAVALPLGAARGFAAGAGQGAAWSAVIFVLVALLAVSWIVIRWICSTVIYVLTDRGPLASMGYSWRLTAGSFWRLFVIYSVALVILIVFYFIATLLGTAVAAVLAHGDVVVMAAVMSVVVVVLGAIAAPFYSALMLSVYGDLSVRKEGADLASRLAAAG